MTDAKQPAQFDWATELSDAQGHVTLSAQEAKEIGARLRSLRAKLKVYEDLGDAGSDVQLLRMGYAAARLEIESLRAEQPAAQPGAAYAALPYQWREKVAELADQLEKCGVAWIRTNGGTTYNVGRNDGAKFAASELRKVLANETEHVALRASHGQAPAGATFQQRVQPWLLECFGAEIAADRVERNHRFLEEAIELVQSQGCTASEAHQLVDYVFGRPVGEPAQEVGGVMVTLAALCLASGLDMHRAGETELARISAPEVVAKIRAKQAAKPKHSPLPEAPTAQAAPAAVAGPVVNRATVIEWLDANDIEVTDRQMDGLFHFAAPTTQPAQQQEAQEPVAVVVPCYTPSGKRVALYSAKQDLPIGTQLYTAPQPSPAAQGDALDTERLDWLALAGPVQICLVIDRDLDGEIEVAIDGATGYGRTLRAAIDAARATQEGK